VTEFVNAPARQATTNPGSFSETATLSFVASTSPPWTTTKGCRRDRFSGSSCRKRERARERAGLQRRMREHQRRWDTDRDYRLEKSRLGWTRTALRRVAHDWEARHADDEPPLLSPRSLEAYNAEKAERRRAAQAVVEERRASRYATPEQWAEADRVRREHHRQENRARYAENVRCFECQEYGHFASDCPQRKGKGQGT